MTPAPGNPTPAPGRPSPGSASGSPGEQSAGFECRRCGCCHFHVVYTRPLERGITRVRACRHCGMRIVTRETLLGEPSRGQYRR